MSRTILKWLFLLALQCVVQLHCEIYQDRPKIRTSDGDLILEPALDKNIYLKPNGPKSSIFIGNVDILKTNTPKDAVQYQPPTNENIDIYLNGPNGIKQRLQRLENMATTMPNSTLSNITRLRRRTQELTRRVMALEAQLNNLRKDECQSHPCQHGGTCLSLVDGYYCLCPSNWEGKDCDVDVNECRNFAGTDLGCQNGATCINRPGTYECLCRPNWRGLHCTTTEKDCSAGDFEMCGYGTCIPVQAGIKCICHQGWTSNATSVACLTDVNECDASQGIRCSVNPKVECVNFPGSFRCGQCPPGYEGDGFVCNDIDECTTITNGGCSPMVTCHNTIGSRICGPCPPGYQGDGVTCTFRGSCNINHGGCHPSAQCVENASPTGQTSLCICPEGMEGDGIGLLGCYVSTSNSTGSCENNPCGIHGRCHILRSGYTCICYRGYSGRNCDTPTNVCAVNPCQNGGICRQDENIITGFRCECTAQYTGTLCQVRSKTCGGILDAEEGSIAFPLSNTTATYSHDAQCAWVIHTVPDKVINVTFSKFNVEYTPGCSGDFLQIHDGRKSSSQLIGRFCGNNFPKGGNIESSHNNLYFWFHSDRTIARAGFALHWTSVKPKCGGETDATVHGHISSPGSPGSYPPNRDCYWHLTTTPGKRISLHFFALDIEAHSNCSFDYLAIYDGAHITDPLISQYCNSTQPAPIQSAGSEILIHFHSDAFGTGNGFQIVYAPVEGVPGCGGYFTADKGEIISPTYNGLYLSNLLCEYKIKTSLETKIKLDFKQFKLERAFRCRYDYLKIYDGPSSDSRLVGKFCGTEYPPTYTSTSNTLYLKFKTDRSLSSEGFRISYESICEKTLLGDSGIVKSPSYPFSYPANKVCTYIIRTEPGKAIQLTFQDFDIEDNNYYNCRYDHVEIRDGPDGNSTLLGRYCGGSDHTPPVQTSTHNYMYIRFRSDMSLSGTGFYANYTTIDTECGGIHRETTGLINHPSGDSSAYKNDQTCQWLLIAPEGMHIKLTWNRFEIEHMSKCDSDYLEIVEIDQNNENSLLGKYCGTRTPPSLTTSSNRLKLKFVSDSSIRQSGFSVSYTFLDDRAHCGGNYVKSHGYIYSPGWPKPYASNRDCTWIIRVPPGQQISLNISNFDLERPIRNKCDLGDYLEIRNGGSETSPIIGQYCGKIQSMRITSLANVLHLHFHSDFYLTGGGFKIEWDGRINGCGGTLTSSTGSITSPNYPDDYHENAECFYRIVTSAGARIRISFTELDLERTSNCRDDYIEIYDGRDTNAQSLGRHCRLSSELTSIETTNNLAFIKFRSDMYIGAKGFVLNYNTICNNNLTGRYGVIESPNYPNNYPMNIKCLWNVEVPKGNKINVTFTHFDIYKYQYRRSWFRHNPVANEGDCVPDYLQIKEKSDLNFAKKLCGYSLPSAINTKSNSIQIQFSTGYYAPRTGFRLEWVSHGCGGHIQKQFGTVSLDKSVPYENEMECEWLIETAPGKSISLTFTEIYVTVSPNCSTDAIEIYNGQNTKAPLLSKICQNNHMVSIQSDSNFMLIRFIKTSARRNVGFESRFHSSNSKCGGFITSMSGYFYSKNYPKNYDNNLDCIWYIRGPANHRIEISFEDLDLYSSRSTFDYCGDSIFIYDNNNDRPWSNYTDRICPDSNKRQIVTKYNNVIVQFKTNDQGTAKGFKANFTVTCGGLISATRDGIITNDKFINNLNKSCVWTVVAPIDQKITLTLTHMSLPKDANINTNRNCPSSYLRVLDGNDKDAPLIGEYCGRKVPAMIVSRGNSITIELGSYTDRIGGIFSAHYSPVTNACGGTLNAEEGVIASPAYPSPYPVNSDCEWIVSTSPGNTAYITFERFDLEYSEGCNEDYVEVRENDGGGNLFGVYCGNVIPTNYTTDAKIYIKFHSDSKTNGLGFLLHYGYFHENNIQGENGMIASPLYPMNYEGAGEFTWRIISFGADKIALTIDTLEIPAYGDVSYNKLTIFDGYDSTAPVLEQLHGALGDSKIIQTSSSVVYLVLTMDDSNSGSRFHLSWTKFSSDDESSSDQINCGGNRTELILQGQTSTFQSPNYPEEYENYLNCQWVYRTEMGRHLSLSFIDFEIEEINNCFADSISIYSADTPGKWKPVKEEVCEFSDLRGETNGSTYMKVNFKTDSSIRKKGFLARVSSKCGGLITNLSGEFGPTWLDVYSSDPRTKMICEWTIKVRPGRTIQLNFIQFNITNKNEDKCAHFVVLRNGDSMEAPLLESGKYCGYEHEKKDNIATSSNSLFVRYTSETHRYPFVYQSFRIYYQEKNDECGSTSTLTTDHKWEIISSPSYPNPPTPYSDCVWIFSGPPGEIIRIDFLDRFDLDNTDDCVGEVVEIRDGSSNLAPRIGQRFCGEKPGTIKSTGNTIYIKYSTQLAEPRNGFKANVSIDICGGTIIASSGELKSPGYPQMQVFPAGTTCEWRIIGPPRHVFSIKAQDISLPQSQADCGIKVTIEETIPVNNTIVILKTICNRDDESDMSAIETLTNNVTIKLTIGKPDEWDQISENRGFRIAYNSSRPMCGGSITASEGYLSTPSYPQETTIRYCFWRIEVPDKSRSVRLELIDTDQSKQKITMFNDLGFRSVIKSLPPTDNQTIASQVYRSVGNKLAVYVWLNRTATSHRFKAKFTTDEEALCGGSLSGTTQELVSPNLQRAYLCEWHYNNQVPSNNVFNNLTFNSIYITAVVNSSETETRCRGFNPQMTLKSPVNDDNLFFKRNICGHTSVSYRIPSSILDITASKSETKSLYFQLNWKSEPCGGVVHVGENPVNILNVPSAYNDTLDCAWILRVNNRIKITMEGSFQLDCDNEFISITQGLRQNTPEIGHYCKDQRMENPLITHYSYIYIQYHSNVKPNNNLRLTAETVLNQCGGYLASYQNVFRTPNYPKPYIANQECAWEIEADLGYRVSLQFVGRFLVEDVVNCTKDVVIIYDWIDDAYVEMARVCGRNRPLAHDSTYNRMKVVFRTDAEIELDGFQAQWNPICGGNLTPTLKEQILYSPGYPYTYKPNMHCSYQLTVPNEQKIIIRFLEFELEGFLPDCLSDNLTITASGSYDHFYEVFCGNKLPPTLRSFDSVTLDFKTDRYLQRKGFKIAYSIFACGGKINDTTVITPTFDDNENYGANMNCTWVIQAPPNKIAVVKFLGIEIESHPECYNDYVALYDGSEINNDKRLALMCGFVNSTTVLRSTGTSMVLQFVSDSSVNFRGFKAAVYFSYSEASGCGGRINLTAGSSYDLRYPPAGNVVYQNFLDCHWSIASPENTVIKITFKSFHISPCENLNQTAIGVSKCDCDLVEVVDGLNPNSLVIGTYCGHTLPPQLITSENIMSVRLSTDGELESSGFEATISIQPSVCGQSVIAVSGTPHRFKSPGYDTGAIPRGLHCSYHLDSSSEPYNQIRITIINLQLRSSVSEGVDTNRCNKDRLIISSTPTRSNVTSGKDYIINNADDFFTNYYFYELYNHLPSRFELCGHKQSIDFFVYGSTSINLITSPEADNEVHKGVEVEIAFVGFCGRNYTELQGRVQTYYGINSDVQDCYTLITAPENHTISGYFLSVTPDYSDENTYLEIFDGDKTSAKQLVKIEHSYENSNYPVFSSSRYLLLHNHQIDNNRITFDMSYVTTDKGSGCGGKMNNLVGAVTSPLYPKTYRNNSVCEWELETPVSTRLMIRFDAFDLGAICEQNYLQLVTRTGEVARTYCSEMPADYTSNDNYLKLLFKTSFNNAGKGWSATFIATN
ncbi:cubilin [Anticarsia gemmatalis]|uniref:cubilin n=1 Tax=Anticarsia gemmatalis TaxID=129554 RepID=UPI003F764BF3